MSWRSTLRLQPGQRPAEVDAGSTPRFDRDKEAARTELAGLLERLNELQTRLYASRSHGLLVVLQGRDASGKDGLMRKVLGAMSPLGFRVAAFAAPDELEERHDFLWRAH